MYSLMYQYSLSCCRFESSWNGSKCKTLNISSTAENEMQKISLPMPENPKFASDGIMEWFQIKKIEYLKYS